MRIVKRVLIGFLSVVFLFGGVTIFTPLGSEAKAGDNKNKILPEKVKHEDLHNDHEKLEELIDKMGEWIEKIEIKLQDIESAVDGKGNHTLRWDRKLDSTDGVDGGVRDGCDSSRFKCIFGDKAVLDMETGLVWNRELVTPDGTWIGAHRLCANLSVDNRKGWSLAMLNHLTSLVDRESDLCTGGGPCLPDGHPFLDVKSKNYLTATSEANPQNSAFTVDFSDGNVRTQQKGISPLLPVWCVRGAQSFDGTSHKTLH